LGICLLDLFDSNWVPKRVLAP